MGNYRTLLTESVRSAGASWEAYLPALRRDPQGRASNPLLDPGAMEAAFRAHVASLQDGAAAGYAALLEERLLPLLPSAEEEAAAGALPAALSAWAAAEAALRGDARLQRMPEAAREGAWRRFVEGAMWDRDHPGQERRSWRWPDHAAHEGGAAPAGPPPPGRGGVKDRAYEREYLEFDRKRIRRD
jgi:hypothetical protein